MSILKISGPIGGLSTVYTITFLLKRFPKHPNTKNFKNYQKLEPRKKKLDRQRGSESSNAIFPISKLLAQPGEQRQEENVKKSLSVVHVETSKEK
jgi:hypothetical protein